MGVPGEDGLETDRNLVVATEQNGSADQRSHLRHDVVQRRRRKDTDDAGNLFRRFGQSSVAFQPRFRCESIVGVDQHDDRPGRQPFVEPVLLDRDGVIVGEHAADATVGGHPAGEGKQRDHRRQGRDGDPPPVPDPRRRGSRRRSAAIRPGRHAHRRGRPMIRSRSNQKFGYVFAVQAGSLTNVFGRRSPISESPIAIR